MLPVLPASGLENVSPMIVVVVVVLCCVSFSMVAAFSAGKAIFQFLPLRSKELCNRVVGWWALLFTFCAKWVMKRYEVHPTHERT